MSDLTLPTFAYIDTDRYRDPAYRLGALTAFAQMLLEQVSGQWSGLDLSPTSDLRALLAEETDWRRV